VRTSVSFFFAGICLLGTGVSGLGWSMARGGDEGAAGGALPAAEGHRSLAAGGETPYAWLLADPSNGRLPVSPPAGGPFPLAGGGSSPAGAPPGGTGLDQPQPSRPWECMPFKAEGPPREFHFTRGIYSSGGGGGFGRRTRRGSWCIDHPKAEEQFLGVLDRLTGIDAHHYGNAIALDDPDLRRFPILYMLEVGYMGMTEPEVEGLRSYLLAGGTLIIDDFWGSREWFNWEMEIRRVLPEFDIVELPMDHQVYRTYYQVDTVIQVPAFRGGWGDYSNTSERDGYVARNFGIFDDRGRLMVIINWNTDLGDAWEWMEQPTYPLRFSTYAYQVGVNYIIYGMSN